MRLLRGFLRAVGGVVLDLLWVLGFVQPDRAVRRGWRARVVYLLGLLLVIAFAAGWLPLVILRVRANVAGWLAVVVIGALGVFFTLLALAGFAQMAYLLWVGRRVTATVVCETESSADPHFRFTDPNGETIQVRGPVSSVTRAYGAGEQVPLVYDPDHPATFVVDRFGDKWGLPLLLLGLGLICLLGPAIFLFDLSPFIARRLNLFAPLMFVLVGGFFAACGFTALVKGVRFRRRAARAVGVVVGSERGGLWPAIERRRAQGQKLLNEPPPPGPGAADRRLITVEFEDAAGARHRGSAEVSGCPGRPGYEVGAPVPVRYDPARPWDIQTDTSWHWFGPLVVGVFGSVFVVVGLLIAMLSH
jgi:hypothetical protein